MWHNFKQLVLVFALPVFALISPQAVAQPKVEIEYGTLDRQKLDIYSTANMSEAPVMVFIHGGGWHIGNKKRVHRQPAAFNREGFVYVSVGYPLLPDHPVETQVRSVAMAIAWITENIETYGGDPGQLYLMGHSAGAHLAALSVIDPQYLAAYKIKSENILGLISVDGATLNVPWRMENLDVGIRYARRMFRQTFGEDRDRWQTLSPSHYISDDQIPPPTLFLTAEEQTVSNMAADQVVDRLEEVGGKTKVVHVKNRNHLTIHRRLGRRNDAAFDAILTFIDETWVR